MNNGSLAHSLRVEELSTFVVLSISGMVFSAFNNNILASKDYRSTGFVFQAKGDCQTFITVKNENEQISKIRSKKIYFMFVKFT